MIANFYFYTMPEIIKLRNVETKGDFLFYWLFLFNLLPNSTTRSVIAAMVEAVTIHLETFREEHGTSGDILVHMRNNKIVLI